MGSDYPEKGWILVGEDVIELSGARALEVSRDPEIDNREQQVFWTREGAENHLESVLYPEGV